MLIKDNLFLPQVFATAKRGFCDNLQKRDLHLAECNMHNYIAPVERCAESRESNAALEKKEGVTNRFDKKDLLQNL